MDCSDLEENKYLNKLNAFIVVEFNFTVTLFLKQIMRGSYH